MRRYKLKLFNQINEALEDGKNICILHSYRTGSTPLGLSISKFFDIPYYDEINHLTHPGHMSDESEEDMQKKIDLLEHPCVYKINYAFPRNNDMLNNSFKIRTLRRNIKLQSISYLMARQDKQWQSYETFKLENNEYSYDAEKLQNTLDWLTEINERTSKVPCDRHCYYEDLVNNKVLDPHIKVKKLQKNSSVIAQMLECLNGT